jgi:cell division protein ZapA (FtsZ GTPase activity inhibitor)
MGKKQDMKVEVSILNQTYTFVGEDEEQIVRAAEFVDGRIRGVIKDYGIVNTLNAVMMAMMSIAAEYLETKERVEKVEDRTLRLLKKVEEFDVPCGVRDRWQT